MGNKPLHEEACTNELYEPDKKDVYDEKVNIVVQGEQESERIDRVIANAMDALSRSYIQKIIKENLVLVNDIPVKSSYRVCEGDKIQFRLPKAVEPDINSEKMDLDILYEDEDLIFINKPKNMVVHPAAGHYSNTLVNGIMYHCGGQLSGINGVLRPGIVHRIDKDTTGVLVVCKNDMAHRIIAKQLKEHTITRQYFAIVHGNVENDEGIINKPIGRNIYDRKKMAVDIRNGKEAVTHYKVLQRFEKFTYVLLELETGRTHQIRVHMTSIGHPLLGDSVYGNRPSKFKLEGQTLHAGLLGVVHPVTGEYLEVAAPLPGYFEQLLKVLV